MATEHKVMLLEHSTQSVEQCACGAPKDQLRLLENPLGVSIACKSCNVVGMYAPTAERSIELWNKHQHAKAKEQEEKQRLGRTQLSAPYREDPDPIRDTPLLNVQLDRDGYFLQLFDRGFGEQPHWYILRFDGSLIQVTTDTALAIITARGQS